MLWRMTLLVLLFAVAACKPKVDEVTPPKGGDAGDICSPLGMALAKEEVAKVPVGNLGLTGASVLNSIYEVPIPEGLGLATPPPTDDVVVPPGIEEQLEIYPEYSVEDANVILWRMCLDDGNNSACGSNLAWNEEFTSIKIPPIREYMGKNIRVEMMACVGKSAVSGTYRNVVQQVCSSRQDLGVQWFCGDVGVVKGKMSNIKNAELHSALMERHRLERQRFEIACEIVGDLEGLQAGGTLKGSAKVIGDLVDVGNLMTGIFMDAGNIPGYVEEYFAEVSAPVVEQEPAGLALANDPCGPGGVDFDIGNLLGTGPSSAEAGAIAQESGAYAGAGGAAEVPAEEGYVQVGTEDSGYPEPEEEEDGGKRANVVLILLGSGMMVGGAVYAGREVYRYVKARAIREGNIQELVKKFNDYALGEADGRFKKLSWASPKRRYYSAMQSFYKSAIEYQVDSHFESIGKTDFEVTEYEIGKADVEVKTAERNEIKAQEKLEKAKADLEKAEKANIRNDVVKEQLIAQRKGELVEAELELRSSRLDLEKFKNDLAVLKLKSNLTSGNATLDYDSKKVLPKTLKQGDGASFWRTSGGLIAIAAGAIITTLGAPSLAQGTSNLTYNNTLGKLSALVIQRLAAQDKIEEKIRLLSELANPPPPAVSQ